MNILNLVGDLKYKNRRTEISIPLSEVREGSNEYTNHLVYKKGNKINVYDRICDHSGGKLFLESKIKTAPSVRSMVGRFFCKQECTRIT